MAVERTAVPRMTAASAPIMVNVAELMTRVRAAAGSQRSANYLGNHSTAPGALLI